MAAWQAGGMFPTLHVDKKDSCLWAAASAILGAVFDAPFGSNFSTSGNGYLVFRQRCCITQSCRDGLLKSVMLLHVVPKSISTFLEGVKSASKNC